MLFPSNTRIKRLGHVVLLFRWLLNAIQTWTREGIWTANLILAFSLFSNIHKGFIIWPCLMNASCQVIAGRSALSPSQFQCQHKISHIVALQNAIGSCKHSSEKRTKTPEAG
ncbi:hypothetical protein NMG60_11008803 [Bertholletia excelsa]